MQVALACATPVRWLIAKEPDLYRRVCDFIAGRGDELIEVAGPPTASEILQAHTLARKQALRLPLVKLHLRWVAHHLTGERGVEVKCSDADLDEVIRWGHEAKWRTALAAKTHN